MQVGERKGLDIVGAALEIQRQRVRHRAGNAIAGQRHAAVLGQHRFGAERARRQFERHRGLRLSAARERQRHLAHHLVGVGIDIERTNVLLLADRDPLSRRRPVAAQGFTQHHLAGGRSLRKRPKKIAIEAAHSSAQQIVTEGNLGQFDRGRKYHIETHHLGATVDDRVQDPADFGGPGQRRRSLEGRRLIGLLVDRDHRDRRRGGIAARTEDFPPQRGESVDRPAMGQVERRQRRDEAGGQHNENDRDRISSDGAAHGDVRLSNRYGYSRRTRRPMIGAEPGSAPRSTRKTARREPRLAA